MRIIILTSLSEGIASLCLPGLVSEPNIEIAMVVYNTSKKKDYKKAISRSVRKIRRIGVLGALNGIRIRPWFSESYRNMGVLSLEEIVDKHTIRLERTPTVNCQRTVDLFKEAQVDLGISLGNGYIGRRVFSVPRLGMVNVHHELLPAFQGAASIIWQIHAGSMETGYTIHQIDNKIDTGKILFQEKMPIELMPTLRQTTIHNCGRLFAASVKGLVDVLKNYPQYAAAAFSQVPGPKYTTPTFSQYIRMEYQHRRLYQAGIRQVCTETSSNPINNNIDKHENSISAKSEQNSK
jgi:methionyl-tRNA formyltransferase